MTDLTALSYWFPLLEAGGVPVPKTKIMTMPEDAIADVWAMFDGPPGPASLIAFADQIAAAADEFGYPFFLRTDHTSGKHGWDQNCCVQSREVIYERILGIAEYSEMAGFPGLPWDVWAVREMLPTIPFGVCPEFGNMPICREFRFFVKDGKVECQHPYWPNHALRQGGARDDLDYGELCRIPDQDSLIELAERAGRAVPGHWSIDILETTQGWVVTDMAEAHKSYHWPECANAR